jgi:glycosyltransferase involved in cell wall biosynthesis
LRHGLKRPGEIEWFAMNDRRPKVTVGLPVYNGERYLRAAIDSILAQTYTDFELVISDNGSTDSTPQICRDYAARDPRVRYHRYDENRGPAWNHNHVVELARGAYFKWAACDDLCAPQLLEECVAKLEAEPEAVLAFPQADLIDPEGRNTGPTGINDLPTDSSDPARRFSALILVDHKKHCVLECFGVMRTAAARKAGLFAYLARGDSIFLVRLALRGRFLQVKRTLFFNRDHPKRSTQAMQNGRDRGQTLLSRWIGAGPVPPAHWWNNRLKGKLVFPEWRLWWEYAISPGLAGLNFKDRWRCYAKLVWFTLVHTPKLMRDLLLAGEFLLLSIACRSRSTSQERVSSPPAGGEQQEPRHARATSAS